MKNNPDDKLSFEALREVNVKRCEAFFHDLNEWSPLEWAANAAGEMGETCNAIKKLWRLDNQGWMKAPGDSDHPDAREKQLIEIGNEIADTVIYLDLLAARLGIDLGEVITRKFNEVSDRVGSEIKLGSGVRKNAR